MEHKLIPVENIEFKFDSGGAGVFAGYASKFDGVDSYGDTIKKGAFAKTIAARDRPIRMRWNHWGPVIGKWLSVEEDDAGLLVKGELTPGHSVASDVYASMTHGAVDGMSIGYIPVKAKDTGKGQRELLEIELIEISVVEEPADLGAKVGGIKSVIDSLDLKDLQSWLRKEACFSRADTEALVHRIKHLTHGKRDESQNASISQHVAAQIALHANITSLRGK